MKAKVKIGDIVRVRFWDHATGTDPMEFYCYGRVSVIDSLAITLETWAFADEDKADDPDLRHNQDLVTLIRSTITEIIRYAPERQPGVEAAGDGPAPSRLGIRTDG